MNECMDLNEVEGCVKKIQPRIFSLDEPEDVGKDEATQVATAMFSDMTDSKFTGRIASVEIHVKGE